MFYTDDPIADFYAHDAEQEKRLARLPVCDECGHHIQNDHFYLINGENICPDCLECFYRKEIDDYAD